MDKSYDIYILNRDRNVIVGHLKETEVYFRGTFDEVIIQIIDRQVEVEKACIVELYSEDVLNPMTVQVTHFRGMPLNEYIFSAIEKGNNFCELVAEEAPVIPISEELEEIQGRVISGLRDYVHGVEEVEIVCPEINLNEYDLISDWSDLVERTLAFNYSTDEGRKEVPLFSGLLTYFPDALKHVANCSYIANEQHNPNEPLHWNKGKSRQELDCLMRHLVDSIHEDVDNDGIRHLAKVCWRALAELQRQLEGISEYKNNNQ